MKEMHTTSHIKLDQTEKFFLMSKRLNVFAPTNTKNSKDFCLVIYFLKKYTKT